jgi:peroxiredoxin
VDTEPSLQQEIDETMAALVPADIQQLIVTMIDDLRQRRSVPGLGIGTTAPLFELPDARGATVSLTQRLTQGPVVLSFYRGAWCPACNLELRALQALLGEISRRGATLVAISPQAPDDSLTFAEKLQLGFDVLSDLHQSVADAYRVRFRLSEDLIALYERVGMALPDLNADGTWDLPVPATFVIDTAGTIRASHVDADYRQRMDPAAILAALDELDD